MILSDTNYILNIKNDIIFVEKEVEAVEKLLQKINQIKINDRIDDYVRSLNLKYDISEEIVEYKTNLKFNPNALIFIVFI